MQTGEGTSSPTPEPAEEKKPPKMKVKIRCSLFFDGTLNNRVNIDHREQNTDSYQKYGNKKDDSYENGRTNIALMEPLVLKKAKDYDVTLKTYIEGPGTIDKKSDYMFGYGMGIGKSGIGKKVKKGIDDVFKKIKTSIDPEETIIEKLTLDVFGFSRGAACARYAIHELLKNGSDPIQKRLEKAGFEITGAAVEVCFAGLYDTVSSHGFNFKNDTRTLKLDAIRAAEKVIHLASAEEHRKNFSLTNIKSAGANGQEFFLPGVHSDVGGSYLDNGEDDILINYGSPEEIAKDRASLIADGWYTEKELIEEVSYDDEFDEIETVYLTAKRQNIRNVYNQIPLKIMAKFARENGINIHGKLEVLASRLLVDPKLQALEAKINSYIACTGKSKPEDWLGRDPLLCGIRHNHLHFSAKYKFGLEPRFNNGKRFRMQLDG